MSKGENVHQDSVRQRLDAAGPSHLVLLDLGSRGGPVLDNVPTLVIDHHRPDGFPDGAVVSK